MKYTSITIAGRICTGKSSLSAKIQEKLQWQAFSTGKMFREYAKKHGLSIQSAQEQVAAEKIDTLVQARLKNEQNLIVDSWVAGYLAKHNEAVLKVLLICDRTTQINRLMQREHVSIEQAVESVDQRETALLAKLHKMYQVGDILDPKHYNIVIDTTTLSVNQVAEQVLNKLHER